MATTVDSKAETVSLIGSDKVDGTAVYGADDRKIGSVQRVMIDKVSGKVAYAVISFGGFLGMGEDYYPMPWPNLKYDTTLGGYRVGVTVDQLKGAPKYNRNTDWDWSNRARCQRAGHPGARSARHSKRLSQAARDVPLAPEGSLRHSGAVPVIVAAEGACARVRFR
jgi:hypothetical protein